MKQPFSIPALTPELSFATEHWREMEEVAHNNRKVYEPQLGSQVINFVDETYSKASEDVKKLILPVTQAINDQIPHVRVSWHTRGIEENWGTWGHVRRPGGTNRPIRWAGAYLDVGKNIPRLMLCLSPKGGENGSRTLREACRRKGWPGDLIVIADELDNWPGWEEEASSLIYHVRVLNTRSSLNDVVDAAAHAAKQFLRLAIPALRKMSPN